MQTAQRQSVPLATWQSHLRFSGRAPRTLAEIARAQADCVHASRLATIRAMAPKLAKLDELLPAIVAKGVDLHTREISSYDGGKTLSIARPICSYDDKLYDVLLALGFAEIERRKYAGECDVTLKHGRSLRIKVSISHARAVS